MHLIIVFILCLDEGGGRNDIFLISPPAEFISVGSGVIFTYISLYYLLLCLITKNETRKNKTLIKTLLTVLTSYKIRKHN